MARGRSIDSAKLVALRNARHLDQTELASRLRKRGLGTTQATVSRWENGQAPSAYALPAIAAELGVTVDELYASDEDEEAARMPSAFEADLISALREVVRAELSKEHV